MDDLLVTSPDHKTHKKHLRIIFAQLAEYGIIIGPEKCQFGTTKLSFLGHHVCAEGISLLPHLAFIAEFTTDIRYVKGETNFVADALSRPSVSAINDKPVINYKELSIDQAKDA